MARSRPILKESIGVIGSGPAGLISAQILLRDGFEDVTIISRDNSVGGTWARERIYPGLQINHVHGEYRFSGLEMDEPDAYGPYLTGENMCDYMEKFSKKFLEGKATLKLHTQVKSLTRVTKPTEESPAIWHVQVQDTTGDDEQSSETLIFNRIILATGFCDGVHIGKNIHPEEAKKVGYEGLVFHSSEFGRMFHEVVKVAKVDGNQVEEEESQGGVVVVGGGKSAQDIAAQLTREGCKVTMVFQKIEAFTATRKPLPVWLRRGRLMSTLMPYHTLQTRVQRFFQETTLGSKIVHFVTNSIPAQGLKAYNIPEDSPLRLTDGPLFWGIGLSDAGLVRENSFQAMVRDGAINIIAPMKVSGYSEDGAGVMLGDGNVLPAKAIILATGYKSSWPDILCQEMMEDLGMDKHTPAVKIVDKWKYKTMQGGDAPRPDDLTWTTSIYRGLVPAKNIFHRDFALAGALFSSNAGYTNEVVANWTSAYFMGDKMRLPATVGQAVLEAEERTAWNKFRYPFLMRLDKDHSTTSVDTWTWPQAADELLEDMYLPSWRSGGYFKVIESKELATLGEERRKLRSQKN